MSPTPHGRRGPTPAWLGWLMLVVVGMSAWPAFAAAAAPTAASGPSTTHAHSHLLPTEIQLLDQMASHGTNVARLFELGDLCHDAGVQGDKKAVERAEKYLRQLLAIDTNNVPGLALLGSVYTMKGRDAFWPNQQLRLVHEGNRYMDQALQKDPDNLRARLIRGFNNAHMPDFLGRTETVRADLAWLAARAEKEPGSLTVSQRQELALHQGRQLKKQRRTPEAVQLWERARALQPDSRVAAEIAAELAKAR